MAAKIAKADLTPVRQRTQYTCMSASMSMCLQAHGHGCDEDEVNRVMGARPMQGATWEQALACAQHYGMRGTLTSPCTFKQLKAWTDAGTPVIIAWNPEGREWSHASVVFDVDDDENVHVADPNIPDPEQTVRVVPKAEFYAKWYEKWPKYLVRRPAMAIEREITQDGRQVMAADFMAGKKELRSQKDKGMARFLKQGPVRPTEKSDAAKAMSKAHWEALKSEGRAGLPGAGGGAGYHKDKSQYDRGHGKSVEREAGSLTQPLMTRRDYGAVTASDYASILKYAVDLPADVERYVEEGTDAGMPEDKAWAVAWSRYCKYKNPESEHCQMNKSEYFPGRKAKFERGVSMTVDEVAEVVGPEFKEMNEDPPESVKKVMEGMQGKTARRSPLLAMEQFADMLRDGKFEEGVPADPTENMSPEDAAEWERQTEEHKDEFKTADLEAVLHRDGENNAIVEQFFHKSADVSDLWVGWIEDPEGYMARFIPPTPRGAVKRQILKAVNDVGVDLDWTVMQAGKALKTNLDPNSISPTWFSKLPYEDKGALRAFLDMAPGRTAGKVAAWVEKDDAKGHRWMMDATGTTTLDAAHINEIPGPGVPLYILKFILKDGTAMKDRKNYKSLKDAQKAAQQWFTADARGDSLVFQGFSKLAATGLYGFTKETEGACGAGVNKLQKAAKKIAASLYAKDNGSPAFLAKHASKGGSKTASMLLKAMESLGPLAQINKTAGKSGNGLYGFSEKTAKLGLDACSALHHEAGVIAADLFARKGADPVKVAGYLTANAKKGKCAFSDLLAEVAPDVNAMVIGKLAADFMASDETADDELVDDTLVEP